MSSPTIPATANVAVIAGVLSRPAELRTLPKSGVGMLTLDVTVRRAGAPADTVPVAWLDPPAWAAELDVDDSVVVVGRVRRRFFRSGGVTASRTEVVADIVVRARQTKRARSAVQAALDTLAEAV